MAQIIKTVSVSKAEDEFISDNKISPTRLLRNKLQEMMAFQKHGYTLVQIKELERKVTVWKNIAQKERDFLEQRSLLKEFLEAQENHEEKRD